jgi:hypothetical protein
MLTVLCFLFSLPIYVLKQLDVESDDEGHSHMYNWLWTMAFLSGTTPAILLLLMCLVCLFVIFHSCDESLWRFSKSKRRGVAYSFASSFNRQPTRFPKGYRLDRLHSQCLCCRSGQWTLSLVNSPSFLE